MTALAPAPTSPVLASLAEVDEVVATAREAQAAGRASRATAAVLRRAADELEARRGELVTVMAREGGKVIGEADPEVSEAVDFARYYADRAAELDPEAGHPATDGARFTPSRVTVVTPPWNFPVAIPMGSVLAALAAGSAVVVKPAPAVPACTEVAAGALYARWPRRLREVLQVVRTDEGETGRALVSHPDADTVVLTGSIETARLFSGWRADRPGGPRVIAETSGKNAVVVTPAADYDLAVADVVRSAFGHAGQKCSAASLLILVGSAGVRAPAPPARRRRAVAGGAGPTTSAPPWARSSSRRPASWSGRSPGWTRGAWLVEPGRSTTAGRLWSPGLKEGGPGLCSST